jgi:hypothetical protein
LFITCKGLDLLQCQCDIVSAKPVSGSLLDILALYGMIVHFPVGFTISG